MVLVCKPLRDNMLSIFSIRKLVVSPFYRSVYSTLLVILQHFTFLKKCILYTTSPLSNK